MSTAAITKPSLKRKAEAVDELRELVDNYDAVLLASLHKIRASQLQEISKKFRDQVQMKVAKNSILRRAFESDTKPGIKSMRDAAEGSNVLLLTDMNPFRLAILLDRSKVRMNAKAGDVAPSDITVPAGNTGLPPGPAISELNEAGIRTRIESGSVYVIRDTVVAKQGETIQPRVAGVLTKLGIKPLEVGLTLRAAYEGGVFLKGEELHVDLDAVKRQFEDAVGQALALASSSAYPTPEVLPSLLSTAHMNALNIAVNTDYPTPETISLLLSKANADATAISGIIAKTSPEAASL